MLNNVVKSLIPTESIVKIEKANPDANPLESVTPAENTDASLLLRITLAFATGAAAPSSRTAK